MEQDHPVVRVAAIGAGFIAQVAHLPSFAALPGVLLHGIADCRPTLGERVAARMGVRLRYPHPRDVFDDPDVDLVVACVHRRCLAPIVLAALDAGKAVFSEKPMAADVSQGERLLAAARTGGRPYAVGFMRRFDPGVRLFKTLLDKAVGDGDFGDIVHVALRDFNPTYAVAIPAHLRSSESRAYSYMEWERMPAWLDPRWDDEYQYTLNVVSHDINLLRWLFGGELEAQCLRVREHKSQTIVLQRRGHDMVLQIGRSDGGAWDQVVDVFFRKAQLSLRLPSPLDRQRNAEITLRRTGEMTYLDVPPGERRWAFEAQAHHVVSSVRGRAALEIAGEDALHDMRLIETLWRQHQDRP